MNLFDLISKDYEKTNTKPDKLYSMLPTILHLLNPLRGRVVLDMGCGSGFFSRAIAKNGGVVTGIDNSIEQIKKAQEQPLRHIKYLVEDMFFYEFPPCQRINAPFVLNYADSLLKLEALLAKFYDSLTCGKLVAIVDLPEPDSNEELVILKKTFGAIKKVKGELVDGAKIEIGLYNLNIQEEPVCTLNSYYFSQTSLENSLKNVGFENIQWRKPLISIEGLLKFGNDFWSNYIDHYELGYLVAEKPYPL